MAYLAMFSAFVLWPNLRTAPSVLLVVVTVLAGVWLTGGLAAWVSLPRADEFLLCGSAAPFLLGLIQLGYRLHFLWIHGTLTREGFEGDSASAFIAVWLAEVLLVLLPGIFFLTWNARALTPSHGQR
jgi:hypothetical protein